MAQCDECGCYDDNHAGKIKWKEKNPFELMLDPVND